MVFLPAAGLPKLPEIPDSISLDQFLFDEKFGRHPVRSSRDPFTCGVTGTSYTAADVAPRVDYLARAIGKRLGFKASEGSEWDRVVCIYSQNSIDYMTVASSVHRLSGIVTPASAAHSAQELEHQIRSSGAVAIFTCVSLHGNALKAAKATGISSDRIFILPVAGEKKTLNFVSVDDLIVQGKCLPSLEPRKWTSGQGKRQTAYLCFSSGTSGLPKAVMISHYNLIANILQVTGLESVGRRALGVDTQVALGVLPFSHIYGITIISLLAVFRGDQIIVLPKFDLGSLLQAVQTYRIQQLNIVPPILVQIISNPLQCAKYDLSSIRLLYSGAAPLGKETVDELTRMYPKWYVTQGYGLTEASPCICTTVETDRLDGSSGAILPGCRVKLIDADGNEVKEYETRGQVLFQSPSVVLGYLNNERANAETFVWDDEGRWLVTGDEVIIRKSDQGNEHIVVVDRIKELIKVKGHQVAPAELEAHILTQPFVQDCAVIPVWDARSGERPKAYVVKSARAKGNSNEAIASAICKHVEEHKARHKWLRGGVEFIDAIPKSPSGKILRRVLKDAETQRRKQNAAKL